METLAHETDFHVDTKQTKERSTPHPELDVVTAMVAELVCSSAPTSVSVDAVTAVFTDLSILSCIGSFQEDPLAFIAAYRLKMLGPKRAKKEGPAGSLVKEAITRGDLDGLKKIYSARLLHAEAAEKPELCFKGAVNVAVMEGRLDILQWLHARSQQRPSDVPCSPDKATLGKILRKSRMDVVQRLADLRDGKIDSIFLNLLADALRMTRGDDDGRARNSDAFTWLPSLLQLLVRRRPSLHSRILEVAANAGSMVAVNYMLSPRSGVDLAKIAMLPGIIAAARGRHQGVVEVLLAAKRADEVVQVQTVREHLSSVGDAGAVQSLLALLAERDPVVRRQLNEERQAASAIFGFVSINRGGCGSTIKRKPAGRAKAGKRA